MAEDLEPPALIWATCDGSLGTLTPLLGGREQVERLLEIQQRVEDVRTSEYYTRLVPPPSALGGVPPSVSSSLSGYLPWVRHRGPVGVMNGDVVEQALYLLEGLDPEVQAEILELRKSK